MWIDSDKGASGSGRQAHENGLIDQLGGLSLALAIARERAGLTEKSFEIVRFPKRTWLSQIFGTLQFPIYHSDQKQRQSEYNRRHRIPHTVLFARYGGLNTTLRLLNIIREQQVFFFSCLYHISVGN